MPAAEPPWASFADALSGVLDRETVRKELNISSTTLLSVGYLIERKGHHIAIEALQELPSLNLIIVGDGPDLQKLKNLAKNKLLAVGKK